MSALEISKIIKRSKSSILAKASKLKLIKNNKSDGTKRLTKKEKEYIIENYKNKSCLEISKDIGRKEETIYSFIKTNTDGEIKKSDYWWTDDEIFYLKENYEKTEMDEMIKYLNRKAGAIRRKAQKLKLARLSKSGNAFNEKTPLSENQKKEILKFYAELTVSEMARKINRGSTAVKLFCEKNNLKPKRNRKVLSDFSDKFLLESIKNLLNVLIFVMVLW